MAYYIGILIRLLQPVNDLCYQTKGFMKLNGILRFKNDCNLAYAHTAKSFIISLLGIYNKIKHDQSV